MLFMTDDNSESTDYERRRKRPDIPYDEYLRSKQEALEPTQTYQEKKAVWRSYNIIWLIIGLITALLAFRFVFELLGANPYNGFVQTIYTLSYPFAGPFATIFGMTSVAKATFDWSVLVAIVVYILIGYALVRLLRIIRPVTPDEANHRIRTV
jgi:uncharacterized protein YggT (Ycf19 family)